MVLLLRRVSDWTDRLARALLVPIGIGFIFIVFLGVLARYVFQAPIIPSVELARIGFVWSAFLGAAICLKGERHTQFLFLLDKLVGRPRRTVIVAIDLISVGFFLLLVPKGLEMVRAVQDTYFPALGWSQLWLYLPLPLSGAFMLVHATAFLARDVSALIRVTAGAGAPMITPLLIAFVILAVLGVPIAISMGVAVALTMAFFTPFPLLGMVQRMVTGIDSFVLISIPFFMLTGRLMNAGGITNDLFRFARSLVGPIRGGLAHANVIANMILAGMSGSAVADAGGMGVVVIKAMSEQGYRKELAAAITVAASTIGPIIPPSIPMVIYGAMAEVSVGRLFLGGFVPGVLMGLGLMVLIYFFGLRENLPKDRAYSLREVWQAFQSAFLSLLTPVILIGGILSGIFTPTEASAVAAVYAFMLCFVVYKTVTVRDIPGIIVDTFVTTAVVTFIISATSGFSYLLIIGKIGTLLVDSTLALTRNPWVVLLIVNFALLILGCLMEAGVLLILLTPILVPMMKSLGVDLVHFGLVMVLNLMIGVATPPVGMCLFVVSGATDIKLERLMREVIPWVMPLIAVLFLITYFPSLVLVVPNWLMPGK